MEQKNKKEDFEECCQVLQETCLQEIKRAGCGSKDL